MDREKEWYEQQMYEAKIEHQKKMMVYQGMNYGTGGSPQYITRQDFSETLKEFRVTYKVSLVKKALKFFNASYEVGEEVVKLIETKDQANEDLAIGMLFGSFKNTIKEEILKELKEK